MRSLKKLGMAATLACFISTALPADAQIFVKVRPARPKIVVTNRPAQPAGGVWVEEDWRENAGNYEYAGGRWETPPGQGMMWRTGHWKNTPRRGYVWVPGHWVARR